jgi:hexosaminidase
VRRVPIHHALVVALLAAACSAAPGRVASADTGPYGDDVALASAGAVATSSGREVPNALGPELAIDGVWDSDSSRWSGEPADDGWFQVELTRGYAIDHVAIQWSTSCPARYKVQVSNDSTTWVDATGARTPPACRAWDTIDLTGLNQPYQYVRMQGIQRSLSYGYSINEFEVWDGPAPPAPQVTTGAVTDLSSTSVTLHGAVTPAGADTSYQFDYGPAGTGPWGTSVIPTTPVDIGSEATTHDVSQRLTGLKPGTTYFYRLAARVGAEPADGAEVTFTTLAPPPVPVPNDVTPTPASTTQHDDAPPFVLTTAARIVAPGAATAVAIPLAEQLRRATGYQIPVVPGRARSGDIRILVDPRYSVAGFGGNQEAYTLAASAPGVTITAPTPAGAFYGTQTLRQLFPAFVESPVPVDVEWAVPNVHIDDGPRVGYRGVMLDLARNFLSLNEIKRLIDQMSYLKMNALHLHLSDDQGWRIEITNAGRVLGDDIDYPKLTEISGGTAIDEGGTDGLPGQTGFLTQVEYRQVVAYAAAHYVTVIPEIDVPGHSSSMLHAIAQLNTAHSVPQPPPGQDTIPANTTQQVGESSLDAHAEVTYTFLAHVFRQLAAMTPGRYLGVGGDEAFSTPATDYDYFMKRVIGLVHDAGKSTTGWNLSYAAAGSDSLTASDLIQYYNTPDDTTAAAAVNNGAGVIVSYYPYTYLDYPYSAGDFDKYYAWDVEATVPDVPPTAIRGVEAPLWTETLRSDAEAEYQTWPRAAATAEVGWSPKTNLDQAQFSARLAMLGDRWTLQGTNFYPSPLTRWHVAAAGIDQTTGGRGGPTSLHLGTVLAPGSSLATTSVKIDWGDGTAPSYGDVTLARLPDSTHVNGAYQVSGSHAYSTGGTYTAHLQVTARNGVTEAALTIRVHCCR